IPLLVRVHRPASGRARAHRRAGHARGGEGGPARAPRGHAHIAGSARRSSATVRDLFSIRARRILEGRGGAPCDLRGSIGQHGRRQMSEPLSSATRAVRAALESDTQYGAVVPPIHLTSTYAFSGFGEKRCYDYTRSGNPTRDALAEAIASLEGGAGGVITASGMAAVTLVTHLFKPQDLLVVPHDCYGGTYRLFAALARRGARVAFVDQTDSEALA